MMNTNPDTSSYVTKVALEEAVFPAIETWPNLHPQREFTICITLPEFTSVCPKTGLPDFGTLVIEYAPQALCIELKAFKYYLLAYRNVGIFYENVVNKVLEDVVVAIQPRWVRVTGTFSARGGINTNAVAQWHQGQDPEFKQLSAGALSQLRQTIHS
jgi:7-cyano-7-deazaguanine reductase